MCPLLHWWTSGVHPEGVEESKPHISRLLHWCTTGIWLIYMVVTLEWWLQNLNRIGSYIDVRPMYHLCSWLLHWHKFMPWMSALTLMYSQCTPIQLALILVYHWCTTDGIGSYTGTTITKTLIVLGLTLVCHWCTTDGIGSYTRTTITKTSMIG